MKYNKKQKSERQKFIEHKMKVMEGEHKPMKQKLAIAYSYAKKKGLA